MGLSPQEPFLWKLPPSDRLWLETSKLGQQLVAQQLVTNHTERQNTWRANIVFQPNSGDQLRKIQSLNLLYQVTLDPSVFKAVSIAIISSSKQNQLKFLWIFIQLVKVPWRRQKHWSCRYQQFTVRYNKCSCRLNSYSDSPHQALPPLPSWLPSSFYVGRQQTAHARHGKFSHW